MKILIVFLLSFSILSSKTVVGTVYDSFTNETVADVKIIINIKEGTIYTDKNGKLIKSCFRAFDSTYDSFIAHSDFLSDPKKSYRYGFLFELEITDYKKWAKGLRKSGYATDPNYPKKLIQIIEKYELYKFDIQGRKQLASINTNDKILKIVNLES